LLQDATRRLIAAVTRVRASQVLTTYPALRKCNGAVSVMSGLSAQNHPIVKRSDRLQPDVTSCRSGNVLYMEIEMMLRHVLLLILLVFSITAMGADSEDRTYPEDDVPACMQRDDNGAAISCELKDSRVREQLISPNVDYTSESAAGSPAILPSERPVSPIATVGEMIGRSQ
jgi:hypothetical protein